MSIGLPCGMLVLLLSGCSPRQTDLPFDKVAPQIDSAFLLANLYPIWRSGKLAHAPQMSEVFTPTLLDTLYFPPIDSLTEAALQQQLKLLQLIKRKRHQKLANLNFTTDELERVIHLLLLWKSRPEELRKSLLAFQTWGDDRRGNVQFTGYFTPVLKVRQAPDDEYRYPIYRRPHSWEGPLPTRAQIDGEKVLAGQGLELAYAADPVDIYYMQVQGSGYVEYLDTGERALLVYDGSNQQPYRSIERYLTEREDLEVGNLSINGIKRFLKDHPALRDTVLSQNPSYIFFAPRGHSVKGAGQVPLIPEISVAVDHRYLPLGSVLLAACPVYDKYGEVDHHEFRILLPQDTGGAIRGPGHLDVYSGVGRAGQSTAGVRNHFGRVWLLMPRAGREALVAPLVPSDTLKVEASTD